MSQHCLGKAAPLPPLGRLPTPRVPCSLHCQQVDPCGRHPSLPCRCASASPRPRRDGAARGWHGSNNGGTQRAPPLLTAPVEPPFADFAQPFAEHLPAAPPARPPVAPPVAPPSARVYRSPNSPRTRTVLPIILPPVLVQPFVCTHAAAVYPPLFWPGTFSCLAARPLPCCVVHCCITPLSLCRTSRQTDLCVNRAEQMTPQGGPAGAGSASYQGRGG